MAEVKRDYIIPLRREFLKVPRYQRSKKAIKAVRKFIMKHMKVNDVRILKELNEEILRNGRKNPPSKVSVTVVKVGEKDDVFARVNLIGKSLEGEKKPEKKKKEGLMDKVKGKVGGKKTKKEEEEQEKKEVLEHAKLERKTPSKETMVVKDKEKAQMTKMERIVTRDKK